MKSLSFLLIAVLALLSVGCASDSPVASLDEADEMYSTAEKATWHRAVQDFLAENVLGADVSCLVLWRDPATDYRALFDYSGYWSDFLGLGTVVTGTYSERVLDDGQVRSRVNLQVTGALSQAWTGPPDYVPLFGFGPNGVLAGYPPALAEVHALFEWTGPGPVGGTAPNLCSVVFDDTGTYTSVKSQIRGTGQGIIRGTGELGMLEMNQVGRDQVPGLVKKDDFFPVEWIRITPLDD